MTMIAKNATASFFEIAQKKPKSGKSRSSARFEGVSYAELVRSEDMVCRVHFEPESAEQALARCGWGRGKQAWLASGGDYSLFSMMMAVFKQTEVLRSVSEAETPRGTIFRYAPGARAPIDIVIATWTVSLFELIQIQKMRAAGVLRSVRWIMDSSFFTREKEFARPLFEEFGAEEFIVNKIHSKFVAFKAAPWHIGITTTANFNQNFRTEIFQLIDSEQVYHNYFLAMTDALFDSAVPPASPDGTPTGPEKWKAWRNLRQTSDAEARKELDSGWGQSIPAAGEIRIS